MSEIASDLAARLARMRRDFDESFRVAHASVEESFEELLAIRVGGDAFAVRLAEVAVLAAAKRIIAVPSAQPALLGLSGLRGSLILVFDLAALLGMPKTKDPRWLMLVKGSATALAFGELEGQFKVRRAEIEAAQSAEPRVVKGSLHAERRIWPLPSLPRLVRSLDEGVPEALQSVTEREDE